ncbi:MAG: hypothetical protein U0235_17000 [Polyangiaceae bacterium]
MKLERAHRASDDAPKPRSSSCSPSGRTPASRTYGAFIQEQRRLALLQADERRFWKN